MSLKMKARMPYRSGLLGLQLVATRTAGMVVKSSMMVI